jgi:hypothetical protein
VLYLAHNRFACRLCQGLRYKAWRENSVQRIVRKAWRIQRKLGAPMGEFDSCWDVFPRPKHMRHATYARLISQLEDCLDRV